MNERVNARHILMLKAWLTLFAAYMDEDAPNLSDAALLAKLKQLREQIATDAPDLDALIRPRNQGIN